MAEKKKRSKAQEETANNLVPLNKRTKDEQRRICSKGGKTTAKKKRELKSMKECFEKILSEQPSDKDKRESSHILGIPEKSVDNRQMVLIAAMYDQARKGNVKAFEEISSYMDKSEADRKQRELENEKLRLQNELLRQQIEELKNGNGTDTPKVVIVNDLDEYKDS